MDIITLFLTDQIHQNQQRQKHKTCFREVEHGYNLRSTTSYLGEEGRSHFLWFTGMMKTLSVIFVFYFCINVVICQDDGGQQDSGQFFSSCNQAEYYKDFDVDDLTSWTKNELQILLEETHRISLPYTNSGGGDDDVWKALQDVDADNTNRNNVQLLYSQKIVSAEPKGTPDTWNREHVWPKSRGVEDSGDDFTDIHHLFPEDWTVNSIRSNRFFDWCNQTNCESPSIDELSSEEVDTKYAGDIFQPPSIVRGDVARALFYMETRYPYLRLTDCPDDNNGNEMAYLSVLLEWHVLDPPSQAEKNRNDRVCSQWQGNRNPFVDYPELVEQFYGEPKQQPYQCGNNNDQMTPAPTPSSPPNNFIVSTDLAPGDVLIVAAYSDDPDLVALVALEDIPAGYTIHLTDNAWTGNAFLDNEGVVSLTVPEKIVAGTVFGYGEGLLYGSLWGSEYGFALAAKGDNIIAWYSVPEEGNDGETYNFLSALSFAGPWKDAEQLEGDTSYSTLPSQLVGYSLALTHFDNYVYNGPLRGSKTELQVALLDQQNWVGSNSLPIPITTQGFQPSSSLPSSEIPIFDITGQEATTGSSSCGGLRSGSFWEHTRLMVLLGFFAYLLQALME